jgi:hypothetical protein
MERKTLHINQITVNDGQFPGVPKNPRHIRNERYAKLLHSIKDHPEMLELRELIVVLHGKNYVTLAGNMRYRAAVEAGYTELPAKIVPEDTPPEQLRAIAALDNIQFGEDDIDIIANDWNVDELLSFGADLSADAIASARGETDENQDPILDEGEKTVTMSFTLAPQQRDIIKRAMHLADPNASETYGNKNETGNKLFGVIEQWLSEK